MDDKIAINAGRLISLGMREGVSAEDLSKCAAMILAYLLSKNAEQADAIYAYAKELGKE